MSVKGLIQAGHKHRCSQTLAWALNKYRSSGRITVAITPSGRPFDFPNAYSPDSVAYIFFSLALLQDHLLINQHRDFLQQEINRFFTQAVDPLTGLARRKTHFGGMKDYAIRDASCYDSTMIAVMAKAVYNLKGFDNPFADFNFKKIILDTYWKGSYFIDDLRADYLHVDNFGVNNLRIDNLRISSISNLRTRKDKAHQEPTGDANVYPFLLGIITDTSKLKMALRTIQEKGLSFPFPMKYETGTIQTKQLWFEQFVPNWERTAYWSNLATGYLALLKRTNKNQYETARKKLCTIIERHGTLFECYTPDGNPYLSRWYHADEGMLWAANLMSKRNS